MCLLTSGRCRRILRVAEPRFRRQLLLTALVWVLGGISLYAFAEDATGGALRVEHLFTWQNILAAVVMVYHFGMLREQFKSLQDRVTKLEGDRAEELKRRLSVLEGTHS